MAKNKKPSKPTQQPKNENKIIGGVSPTKQQIEDFKKASDQQNIVGDETPTSGSQSNNAAILDSNNTGRSISIERWQQAQAAERDIHNADPNNNPQHYAAIYKKYFKYVGLGSDLQGLCVIEIGPADNPALAICENWHHAVVVEPMLSHKLIDVCRQKGIQVWNEPLEDVTVEQVENFRENVKGVKEVWLFNVMQHIIDPDVFVDICKGLADRIRFFEPINYPTSVHHPHAYTIQDFTKWFGLSAHIYKGGSEPAFHEADCAYGVWIRE